MSRFLRSTLAAVVLTAVTATPALAAPPGASARAVVPGGMCRIFPILCQVSGAGLPLDQPPR